MNRRTKTQWRKLISQQQLSGLSAAEFCRRESVNRKRKVTEILANIPHMGEAVFRFDWYYSFSSAPQDVGFPRRQDSCII